MLAMDLHRLEEVIRNSRHLRGTGSILDLAFDRIDDLEYLVSELYRVEREMKQSWCYRIKEWFKRAVS